MSGMSRSGVNGPYRLAREATPRAREAWLPEPQSCAPSLAKAFGAEPKLPSAWAAMYENTA
jgi:hypothetical protein